MVERGGGRQAEGAMHQGPKFQNKTLMSPSLPQSLYIFTFTLLLYLSAVTNKIQQKRVL